MAKSLNKVQIIGHLGNDPEMRYMPNGDAVTTISVATSEKWTDKASGQERERTDWHRVVAFKGLAEAMGKFLRKGSHVFIEGAIRYDSWQDNTGETRYGTKIVASDVIFLDKNQANMNYPEAQGYAQGQQAPVQGQATPATGQNYAQASQPVHGNQTGQVPSPPPAPVNNENALVRGREQSPNTTGQANTAPVQPQSGQQTNASVNQGTTTPATGQVQNEQPEDCPF